MFASTARRAAAQASASTSAYAPKYTIPRTAAGMTLGTAIQVGSIAAGFGVALGSGALFIFGEVPRVRNDILRKLPYLDTYYDRTIPAEDNPF
ncbi:Cytochrome b-c1 complex subunit 10 [Penicillium concentricum]|uniref:Cytochrome b-c1 complex subunit 10 n=1 Tax=Penicillium concentricum TaxID=293559 RepID=A0A9W9S6V7_9EURO|nr:Cytochrome b-c1 complex subunit 10 [Penicillium concentricum]KAJ5373131.1 Cytochrome b-c1 complex subunit 10 [Penicillium concentricum]